MSFDQFKKPQDKAKTDTKNWYSDRYQSVIVQRNLLFIATLVSLGATLVTTLLIYMNIPLVTVEPFAIEVDRRSGIVQVVQPLTLETTSRDEKISNYMLIAFLRNYETIGIFDFSYSMNLIRISAVADIFESFYKNKNPFNKNTQAGAIANDGKKRNVVITSIYYLKPGHAQIRFITEDRDPKRGAVDPAVHYIANIKFEYREIQLNVDEVFLNPLGFYVTSYDISKEAL